MHKPNAHMAILTAVLGCRVVVCCLNVRFVIIEKLSSTRTHRAPVLYKTASLILSSTFINQMTLRLVSLSRAGSFDLAAERLCPALEDPGP